MQAHSRACKARFNQVACSGETYFSQKKITEPTTNPAMFAAHPQRKYAEPKTWLDLMILKLSSNLDESVGDLGELKVGRKSSRGGSRHWDVPGLMLQGCLHQEAPPHEATRGCCEPELCRNHCPVLKPPKTQGLPRFHQMFSLSFLKGSAGIWAPGCSPWLHQGIQPHPEPAELLLSGGPEDP